MSPISQSPKRQHIIDRSSTKAKYRAVANVVAEANLVLNQLCELKRPLRTPPVFFVTI